MLSTWHVTVDDNLSYWISNFLVLINTFILALYNSITYRIYVWLSFPVAMTENTDTVNLERKGLFSLQFQVTVHDHREAEGAETWSRLSSFIHRQEQPNNWCTLTLQSLWTA